MATLNAPILLRIRLSTDELDALIAYANGQADGDDLARLAAAKDNAFASLAVNRHPD